MKTLENLTTDDINALQYEAGIAGDRGMVATCELALYGASERLRESACIEVCEALNAAAAMEDDR